MTQIQVSEKIIEETLLHLQDAGRQTNEKVVLWLAAQNQDPIIVSEVFVPQQESTWGSFRIPRSSMAGLMKHLRTSRLRIAAQVHSHPDEAFHSSIDDEWAIVRHVGALSLVLPKFALYTTVESFFTDTAVFKLSPSNRWEEVEQDLITEHYRIINE